ncbi:MAG: folate family ECF transporter S component [Clostridiales Family XIII bacterium]|nr:folate family ECF transporter S component [Clostridiales Family XIII bacterium]
MKSLAVLAVLLAVRVVLNMPFLTIYLTPQFKLITFAYLADAMAAMLFGPFAALAFGFAGDFLGFLVSGGGGAYFPGFALSEMITCLIFALFFHKREITLPKIAAAWFIDLGVVLLGLNSLWLIVMYGMEAGSVFTFARFVSNIVQSPVHIMILWLVLAKVMNRDSIKRLLP